MQAATGLPFTDTKTSDIDGASICAYMPDARYRLVTIVVPTSVRSMEDFSKEAADEEDATIVPVTVPGAERAVGFTDVDDEGSYAAVFFVKGDLMYAVILGNPGMSDRDQLATVVKLGAAGLA